MSPSPSPAPHSSNPSSPVPRSGAAFLESESASVFKFGAVFLKSVCESGAMFLESFESGAAFLESESASIFESGAASLESESESESSFKS